jgi:hypothetical protein
MILRELLAKVGEHERVRGWCEVKRSAGRRCAPSVKDVKKLEDVGESDPGAGVAGPTRFVQCCACARPPRGRLAFSMHRTGARQSLGRYKYRTPVSATVVPMICARGCVPEHCFIRHCGPWVWPRCLAGSFCQG